MKAAPAGHASYALPHPLTARGAQVALTQEELDEAEQARLRVWVGIVSFGLCYVFQANQVWPLMLFFIGYTLVIFAWLRVRPQVTPSRRVLAIVGDITACSTVLYVGAEKTMWVYMVYHFILTGNSCRFGGPYFWLNEILSLGMFAAVCVLTPVWSSQPALAVGLLIALAINPIYTHYFFERYRRRDRELERVKVQHGAEVKARSEFVASITHDIRTSLSGMKGAGEVLSRLVTTDIQRRTLTVFDTSYRTLNSLLQDVVDVSRLEAQRLSLDTVPFDLYEILSAVELLFAARAQDKGVALRMLISPTVDPMVSGDGPKIERILMNLMGNAVKFTHQGHVTLRVTSGGKRDQVRFEVEDTGIGIADDMQAVIFEPFTQADKSTTRKYGGAGLGLSIVKNFVHLMNGEMGFASTAGAGSRFWVEIPLPCTAAPASCGAALAGTVVVFPGFPRALLDEAVHNGIQVAEQGSGNAHELPLAYIVNGSVPPAYVMSPSSVPPHAPLMLALDASLTTPRESAHFLALPADPRCWSNVLRLEAYRRGSHLRLAHDHRIEAGRTSRGLHILCADDTQSLLWLAEQILRADGYQVVTATNGKDALHRLLTEHVDLAIVDYHMPEMDGMEMMQHYHRTVSGGQRVPIIMLTASVGAETERRAIEAGAAAFMLKPFQAADLLAQIAHLLPGVSTRDAPVALTDHGPRIPTAAIDVSRLESLRYANPVPGFVRKTVALFVEVDALAAFDRFGKARSAAALREALHTLAGSSANVGALHFSALCREQRNLPDAVLQDTRIAILALISREFQQMLPELQEAVNRIDPASVPA